MCLLAQGGLTWPGWHQTDEICGFGGVSLTGLFLLISPEIPRRATGIRPHLMRHNLTYIPVELTAGSACILLDIILNFSQDPNPRHHPNKIHKLHYLHNSHELLPSAV